MLQDGWALGGVFVRVDVCVGEKKRVLKTAGARYLFVCVGRKEVC